MKCYDGKLEGSPVTIKPRELLHTPFQFIAADGSAVDSPMTHVEIQGVETLLVLDTGSDVHLLTKELADRMDLTLDVGEEGTDHAGATMPSWRARSVSVRVGGTILPLRDVAVVPAPARCQKAVAERVAKRSGGAAPRLVLSACAEARDDVAAVERLLHAALAWIRIKD